MDNYRSTISNNSSITNSFHTCMYNTWKNSPDDVEAQLDYEKKENSEVKECI